MRNDNMWRIAALLLPRYHDDASKIAARHAEAALAEDDLTASKAWRELERRLQNSKKNMRV